MKNTIPTRFAGLVVTVAIAASACSSATTSPTDRPVFDPTASTTTTPTPTTTEPGPETTPAPAPTRAIELVAVTIDDIGVASVAPRGWTEAPEGVFTGEQAHLAFVATQSWAAPDPTAEGFELLERQQLVGRVWDLYALESGELTFFLAITEIGDMTYGVQLMAPRHIADHYAESVGTPALEAFAVAAAGPTNGEIELASAIIDDRAIAYAAGGSGPATVVFEAGLGNGMETWALVAP